MATAKLILLYFLAVLSLSHFCFGQTVQPPPTEVIVRVVVRDPNGTPLKAAHVDLAGRKVVTDGSGMATASLQAGIRVITAAFPSFEVGVLVLDISSDLPIERDIVLKPNADCPWPPNAVPPTDPLSSSDYVELEYPSGMLAGYRVRVRADGEITFRGSYAGAMPFFYDTRKVSPADASGLIERFRSTEFWSLCGHYTYLPTQLSVSDQTFEVVTVQIGRQLRRTSDYARMAPPVFRELTRAFNVVVDTERWSPRRRNHEMPLWLDGVGGMRKEDATQLFRRSNLTASDSSGVPLVMYAVQSTWPLEIIRAFFDAGANAKAFSRIGETALMAAVTAARPSTTWVEALIDQGADIDAQDRDGRTALMLAVQHFASASESSVENVGLLLKAKARTDTRDTYGMTALDYLEQDSQRLQEWLRPNHEKLRQAIMAP